SISGEPAPSRTARSSVSVGGDGVWWTISRRAILLAELRTWWWPTHPARSDRQAAWAPPVRWFERREPPIDGRSARFGEQVVRARKGPAAEEAVAGRQW